jgi:hypothetical protein
VISSLELLEANLNDLFVKKAPELPAGGKKWLVQYLPWISVVLGLLTLYDAWTLWHWAHYASALINYANSLRAIYGGPPVAVNRMGLGVWLGLAVLIGKAGCYLGAYTATGAHKKSGWDLLFYAGLLNVAYAVVILFSDYGSLSGLFGAVIGSAIGLYLLFQIRVSYLKQPAISKKT